MNTMRSQLTLLALAALGALAACGGPEGFDGTELAESEDAIVAADTEDFAIVNPYSGRCVDVANYSVSNGGPLHLWDCHYDANQLWRFAGAGGAGESVYKITSRHSGLAIDVSGVSYASGAQIHQWSYVGGQNQQWRVITLGGGLLQFQAVHSGLCMSVNRSTTTLDVRNGTVFRQYTCNSSDWRQQFRVDRRGALTKKALVVLLENEGYRDGLPFNPGFDVPEGLRFSCGGWTIDLGSNANVWDAIAAAGVPRFNACLIPSNWSVTTRYRHWTASDMLMSVSDFTAEEVGVATIYASGAALRYDTIRILQDGDFNNTRIRQELMSLAATHTIDLHVLAHGDTSSFGPGGAMNATQVRALRSIVGLTLRTVYQQNCNASGLNDDWTAAGAGAVTGSTGINSMPLNYAPFIRRWVAGETFANAVQNAFDEQLMMYETAYRFVDIYNESTQTSRNPADYSFTGALSPTDETNDSRHILEGNTSVTL